MLTAADQYRLTTEWLARAHPVPQQAHAEWSQQGVALLPLGKLFAAVRLPGGLVHAAIGYERPELVAVALRRCLRGPVIHDHRTAGQTYYALIQWHAGRVWDYGDTAPCLHGDVYLGVPRLDREQPPGTFWVVRPRYDGDLCRPELVRELIDVGRRQLAADESE